MRKHRTKAASAEPPSVIELKQVVKRWRGATALNGVNLEVREGWALGLLGANGAGKTALLALLAGCTRPSSGEISLFGQPAQRTPPARRGLGVLLQDAELPPDERAQDFLTYLARLQGLPNLEQAVRTALAKTRVSDVATRRCGQLSHGLRRRVALAAALLGAPRLLLLDEPTAGLDSEAAAAVRDVIREERPGKTLVLSTHDKEDLAICDHVARLKAGKIVSCTPVGRAPEGKGDAPNDATATAAYASHTEHVAPSNGACG